MRLTENSVCDDPPPIRWPDWDYRDIFNATEEGIFLHGLDSSDILDTNEAMCRMVGYSRKEMIGMDVSRISAGDPSYTLTPANEWVRKAGKEQPQLFEWRLRHRDGHLIWAEVSLKRTSIGGRDLVLSVVRDINERKAMEQKLFVYRKSLEALIAKKNSLFRESEARYRALYDRIPLGVFVSTPKGKLRSANQEAIRLLGYDTLDDAKAVNPMSRYKDPKDRKAIVRRLKKKGRVDGIEVEVRRKDGAFIWVRGSATLYIDHDNNLPYILAFFQDVTEQKKAEERRKLLEAKTRESQKLEAIGTLAGGIAHDFNNVLFAIIGAAEITLRTLPKEAELYDELSRNLQIILESGKRAGKLVKQILAFSRKTVQAIEPVCVRQIATEASKMLKATLPATITLRCDLDSDSLAMADPTQVHQTVVNLCTNAAHAMRNEGGTLTLRLSDVYLCPEFAAEHPGVSPGPYIRLTVSDTGCGIDPEITERIFDPFFTTKGQGEGTGLGLSVVHGIIKSHKGAITFQSEAGKGSIFHVYLPKIWAAKTIAAITAPENLPGGSERILCVDDEETLVELETALLEKLGYRVAGKTSSREALDLFLESPHAFDLVITDLTMPDLTGDLLAQRITAVRPDLPVLLCTGYGDNVMSGTSGTREITDVLFKPVNVEILARSVRKALDGDG